jgi:hypothetical protein
MQFGRWLAAAVLATWCAWTPALAVAPPSVLRLTGELSPLGWPYSSFAEGTLDAGGRLVFVGSSAAVFSAGGTPLPQRIGAGTILPDGRHVAGVGPPALTADGCAVVRATFESGGEAVVRACGATFTVLLDAGTTAPGGGVIRAFDPPVFAAGPSVVAASATLADGKAVVLRHDDGGVVELARSGNPAASGGAFAAFRLLGVTAAGLVGFHATVSDGPDGLFAASDSGTRAVALVGQGTPAGGSFSSIGGGSVHPGGRWVFRASMGSSSAGVFSVDFSGPLPLLRALAVQGDPVPLPGGTIKSFPGSTAPSIDADGVVAFRALVAGATDPPRPSGVFTVTQTGTITLVVAAREEVTGIGTITRLRDPVIADDGSVVVSAVFGGTSSGLYVWRSGAPLVPLARLGDATSADTGDSRFLFSAAATTTTAESAVFLGERQAIFDTNADDSVSTLAYTGQPGPVGGVIALLGSPVVDGRGNVYFGTDFEEGARFNEALLASTSHGLGAFLTPDRRLLGGGGIRELFPSSVDTLGRPGAGASAGVAFTAALQGSKTAEAVFFAKRPSRIAALARAGQHAGGQRLATFGTPTLGPNGLAMLAQVGRNDRKDAVIARVGGHLQLIALAGAATRSRLAGNFGVFGPPALGSRGTIFHATLDQSSQEGIFIGKGGRLALVAGSGDVSTAGGRLRTFDDPVAVEDQAWFLARIAGSVAPAGLYRVVIPKIPSRTDPPLAVEPILLPGDPAPGGGVIVRLDAVRVGPGGGITVVAGIGGGTASSAILHFLPTVP